MIQDAWAEVRLHDVRLRWYTPLDVRGVRFNVYRFESEDLEEAGRGELLTIEPLSSQDGAYEFVDTTVRPNRAYEYRMERLADGSAAEIVSTLRVQVGTLESAPVVLEIRPDPVTSPVTVVLEVPVKGRVALDLMDVGGRRIRNLLDTEMDQGMHEVACGPAGAGSHGQPLPAGVYYIVMRFNGRTESTRMVAVR